MSSHQLSDMHEWMNEIPTVPSCCLEKPQPREQALQNQWGKKDPVGFDSSLAL